MGKLMEKAPAKINLSLDVLRKREDGYHDVEMVMTMIDLADRIEVTELKNNEIILTSQNRYVPNDARNLAFQAAEIIKRNYNIKQGVHIDMEKKIPVAAGLAGGSSDAAATLRALNRLWDLKITEDELAAMGAEIGSDVSFCVYGGTAIARGRGEKIEHLPAPPPCWVVLAKPTIGVSTAEIYGNLKLDNIQHPNTLGMVEAIRKGSYEGICSNIGNVLEKVTFERYPEVENIKKQMIQFGSDAVLMSGSGPTVFGLVQHDSRMHRVYNGLKGFCEQVYAVRLLGDQIHLD